MSENEAGSAIKTRRTEVGRVVSDKMHKSISVLVERHVRHGVYGKSQRRSRKFHAHDEDNACKVGDVVMIEECRPISKTKAWRLKTILQRAGE